MSNLARVVQGWADDLAEVVTSRDIEKQISHISGRMYLDLYQHYLAGLVSREEFRRMSKDIRGNAEEQFDKEFVNGHLSLEDTL